MNFSEVRTALKTATDDATLAKVIVDTATTLVKNQPPQITQDIRQVIVSHNSPINVRLDGILRHLDGSLPHYEKGSGATGAFFAKDNSAESIAYIVIGVPFLFGMIFIAHHDKLKNKYSLHRVASAFSDPKWRSMGTNPAMQIEQASTFKKASKLMDYLDKLVKNTPIIPYTSYKSKDQEVTKIEVNPSAPSS